MAYKSFDKAWAQLIEQTAKNFDNRKEHPESTRVTFRSISEAEVHVVDFSKVAMRKEQLPKEARDLVTRFLNTRAGQVYKNKLTDPKSKLSFGQVKASLDSLRDDVDGWSKAAGKTHVAHRRDSSASARGALKAYTHLGAGLYEDGGINSSKVAQMGSLNRKQQEVVDINKAFIKSNTKKIEDDVVKAMGKAQKILKGQKIHIRTFIRQLIKANASNKPLLTVSLGTEDFNQALGGVEGQLNKALTEALTNFTKELEANLAKQLGKDILELHASPSLEEDIADGIIDILADKKKNKKDKDKIIKPKGVSLSKPKIKTNNSAIKVLAGLRVGKKKGQIDAQMSPLALRALLQRAISAAIKHNMGKGRARTVLNYRTGRFAENVNIDNVVPRRDGAMIAFYSYMKNPYSTFAEGGAQYPSKPSRDPNLLIKKSMRQLAAAAAVTRFFPMES
jgi:hypothetical protein